MNARRLLRSTPVLILTVAIVILGPSLLANAQE